MKLKYILNTLLEEVDPNAVASANALLLIDKLKANRNFMKDLSQIQMPTDKYKAIIRFAELLGIPEQRFDDYMANMKAQIENDEKNGQQDVTKSEPENI